MTEPIPRNTAARRPVHSPVAATPAEVVREYAAVAEGRPIHGVTHDGHMVWAATGPSLIALDPATGQVTRTLDRPGDAGTAFDGRYLYQLVATRIEQIDPQTGAVVGSIPAPGADDSCDGQQGSDSGMAWADGSLWVGQYRNRRIHRIDPQTGAILRTIEADRFVTGVTWVDGDLWHGTWEGDESELRRVDPDDGAVLERLAMPAGTGVSGLESDGAGLFYCGGGASGAIRAVRRPRREPGHD